MFAEGKGTWWGCLRQGTLESLLWVTRHLEMMQQVSVYEFVVNGVNCFGLVCVCVSSSDIDVGQRD